MPRNPSNTTGKTSGKPNNDWLPPAEGVLPDSLLREALRQGWITADDDILPNVQPASLDLRLGSVAYRLRSSFLPRNRTVNKALTDYQLGPAIPLVDGAVLEKDRPYLIPLKESLRLPHEVLARANPKSSTGRLDIFTRIVVDNGSGFDEIPAGYAGPLYIEVVSRSFTIQVAEGLSLNQIRLVHGKSSGLSDEDLKRQHAQSPLLYQYEIGGKNPRPLEALPVSDGVFLAVDLSGDTEKIVGYRAKKNSQLLDLSKIEHYSTQEFWEPVASDRSNRLILEPEEFYLLVSLEGVAVPPTWAGEMMAFDPTSGELRTHYAGFFDPGFGFSPAERVLGSRAVLEVRAHDVPFALEHTQKIARLKFENLVKPPDKLYGIEIGSSYQNQRLKVSKHFKASAPKASRQASYLQDGML
ncbi:MAG: dCTP deaminase [Chloroflexi bacterium]|jgi:dCTP deaminase|nr:MAG: dCTP deaminase [Chloroflexota bacterium]